MRQAAKSVAALAIAGTLVSAALADKLSAYPVDSAQVSVAGISSGAFMANQLHIAHSADIMGAALVAGGLYGCAVEYVLPGRSGVMGLASIAVNSCMKQMLTQETKPISIYHGFAEELAKENLIDPLSNLAHSRVYLFTGKSDNVLSEKTIKEGEELYLKLGVPKDNILFVDQKGTAAKAGHAWVINSATQSCELNEPIKVNAECTVTQSPYINACNYDQAQDELTHIYGKLKDRVPCADESRLIAFDQKEFVKDGATAENGLADSGYIYVPADCQPGAPGPACRLQVVLHGCEQSAETQVAGKTLGKEFVTAIGVNEWADTNRIIILYPQAKAIGLDTLLGTPWYELPDAAWELNPKGCWNWWGYSDDRQYLTKKGVQVAAIWKMIERIEGK